MSHQYITVLVFLVTNITVFLCVCVCVHASILRWLTHRQSQTGATEWLCMRTGKWRWWTPEEGQKCPWNVPVSCSNVSLRKFLKAFQTIVTWPSKNKKDFIAYLHVNVVLTVKDAALCAIQKLIWQLPLHSKKFLDLK